MADLTACSDEDLERKKKEEDRKWQQRRFRHLNKQYKIKTDIVEKELQPKPGLKHLYLVKFFRK